MKSQFAPLYPDKITGYISGQKTDAARQKALPVINPDTAQPLCELLEDDADTVSKAVKAAQNVFDLGVWRKLPKANRAEVLKNVASLIRENSEELASLDSLSTGLLFHKSTLRQTEIAAEWFDYFADCLVNETPAIFQTAPGVTTTVCREAVGVVGLFTPWNIPLMATALKLSAALVMGNSCVLKPSEQSPLSAWRLMDFLKQAGLPDGVVNMVNGRGHVTGAALAENPLVQRISFTGGGKAGSIIASVAAARFARVTLELGGKSANIICADADYKAALDGSVKGVFGNNGQACLAGSRLFVHRSLADKFIADFVSRAEALTVGRPFDSEADMGPIASESHLKHVLSFCENANILSGGQRLSKIGPGFYMSPTVALAENNSARVAQEEIFGPFATIQIFDDEAEVLIKANDSPYGLAGYIWSTNTEKARRMAADLRAGYVMINSGMIREKSAPFGGYLSSGIDREGGRWSLDFYSEAKTVIQMKVTP